jgi:PPM family protein phosphatase
MAALSMKIAYRSDTGKVRTNNEDAILVDQGKGIFLLADGMGGHNAGEVASKLAVEVTHDYLKDLIGRLENDTDILQALNTAVIKAHDIVKKKGDSDKDLQDMGTTLVVLVIKDNKAFICHAGDSRAYLFRDNLEQLTKDHTLGEYMVEHEPMRRDEVPPYAWHMLNQAIGIYDNVEPDNRTIELETGDILLLCSDGLTGMLADKDITAILKNHQNNIDKSVDSLVTEANNRGGKDNISLILVAI